ncbi:hypothetical protein chiPu_0022424 [Chiloscyllium punctatum]|uniref:Ig-like domain-containing protein n=1 Tax=Chiloscyllium punctatum TaxID=137246 RepID=A0A401RE45_CHIPU|nr:hypothetical protein [Chiloscyllium punctatum]
MYIKPAVMTGGESDSLPSLYPTVAIAQRIVVADSVTGIAGERLDLPCLFIHDETSLRVVQATWLKRREGTDENIAVYNPQLGMSYPTMSGRVLFHNATSGNCTLTIHPLELGDQGVYSCEVNVFPSGKFESRTELTVLGEPGAPTPTLCPVRPRSVLPPPTGMLLCEGFVRGNGESSRRGDYPASRPAGVKRGEGAAPPAGQRGCSLHSRIPQAAR